MTDTNYPPGSSEQPTWDLLALFSPSWKRPTHSYDLTQVIQYHSLLQLKLLLGMLKLLLGTLKLVVKHYMLRRMMGKACKRFDYDSRREK